MSDYNHFYSTLVLARNYYTLPGNSCGGNLHIVLDDANIEDRDITWCKARAMCLTDAAGVTLCNALLTLTRQERHDLYCDLHGMERYEPSDFDE